MKGGGHHGNHSQNTANEKVGVDSESVRASCGCLFKDGLKKTRKWVKHTHTHTLIHLHSPAIVRAKKRRQSAGGEEEEEVYVPLPW